MRENRDFSATYMQYGFVIGFWQVPLCKTRDCKQEDWLYKKRDPYVEWPPVLFKIRLTKTELKQVEVKISWFPHLNICLIQTVPTLKRSSVPSSCFSLIALSICSDTDMSKKFRKPHDTVKISEPCFQKNLRVGEKLEYLSVARILGFTVTRLPQDM